MCMWSILRKTFLLLIVLLVLLSVTVISFTDPFAAVEQSSPSDWIKEEQIYVYGHKIVLDVANATWSRFTDTNSMDPFLDETSNAIQVLPQDPELIEVGDVISYRVGHTSSDVFIHRVIEKGVDDKGVYYIVKGDNNSLRDPFKVRYGDVHGVVVAIIY